MATQLGDKIRELRTMQNLLLRQVDSILNVETSIVSKMERGERRITKEVVLNLADIYNYNIDELLVSFLSDKNLYEIQNEDLGIVALRVAEE